MVGEGVVAELQGRTQECDFNTSELSHFTHTGEVCFAGNLVRWEHLNKKGKGNAYFT